MNEKWEQSKRLKKADGTIAVVWEGRLHNWDGPALIPEGNERKAEYYLYGMQKTTEEWKEMKKKQNIIFTVLNIVRKNIKKELDKKQDYHGTKNLHQKV